MGIKKIYIDAGHGGSDPGAVKYVTESKVNIKVTKYMAAYLAAYYVCDVIADTSADSINTIVSKANKWKADLFVSNHFNAGKGNGYEALVYSSNNKSLGQAFEKEVKAIGQNSRGVKYRPDLGVLRLTNMKAILNECAFVDNKTDIKDWDEDSELKKMGEALAKGAANYLKLPKKSTGSSSSFKVGDKVKLTSGAKYYDGKSIPSWVLSSSLYVREINGDRVVISTVKSGAVTGAVNKKYLKKV